jgi:hypothetical protein
MLSLGAPDSVRCARLALVKRLLSGTRRRRTTIIHRTVRWCTGLSYEPTVSWANGRPRNPRVTRGRANGLMGAPDCVRCARLALVKRLLSGTRRRRTTIIHRTVRWCTGLSGEPTVSWANGRPRNPRVRRGRANGLMGAPDSVRCANGSKSSTVGCARIGKRSTPDSVRWCTGLSGAPVDRRQELPSWIALNGS